MRLAEKAKDQEGNEIEVPIDPTKPPSAFVFKTQIDQFSGRLSYIKVITGAFTPEMDIVITRDMHKERIGKVYTLQGKKLEELPSLHAGDIGVLTKITALKTNDTLGQFDKPFSFEPLPLPSPVHMLAISAVNKKEEDKLNELLYKAAEEDLTFQVTYNPETKEGNGFGFENYDSAYLLKAVAKALYYYNEKEHWTALIKNAMTTDLSWDNSAKEYVKLYAFDGVISTITIIIFNVLFLVIFKLGITGYVLAIVMSDMLSTLFLFWSAKLYRYVRIKNINKEVAISMIKYSIPLIPATIFWWITNVSNRFIVAYVLGSEANGIYAVSYKIPTIIVLISNVFMDAWQMSAVTEEDKLSREKFFSKVFKIYQSVLFLSASGIILFSKVVTKVLVSDAFYLSWKYIPFLVMATTFSCLVTF